MKPGVFSLCFFAAFLALSGQCLAHRVNVFAYVDGDAIQVECGFGRGLRVRNGKIAVADLETGAVILEGVTDEHGLFRFRPSDDFLATGHGLVIRLNAGEGHQNDWKVTAEELLGLSGRVRGAPSSPPTPAAADAPEHGAPNVETPETPPAAGMDNAGIEAIVGRVLDEKLAPFRQTFVRPPDREPDFRDIIGGIGWILGLLGLGTYLKYRRK